MTTQTIDTLREEAKALKVKSWHVLGEDRLIEEIQKAKADKTDAVPTAEPARKKAPRMKVETASVNHRQKKLDLLNDASPEYEHQYRMVGTDPRVIEAKGFEVVEGEFLGDEIVVRTMKDSFVEWQNARNDAEAKKMERGIDDTNTKILRQNARPKDHIKEKT
jgi:hypothetical protein